MARATQRATAIGSVQPTAGTTCSFMRRMIASRLSFSSIFIYFIRFRLIVVSVLQRYIIPVEKCTQKVGKYLSRPENGVIRALMLARNAVFCVWNGVAFEWCGVLPRCF